VLPAASAFGTLPKLEANRMRQQHYAQLLAFARRCSRRADEAEDLVNDALIVALEHGRSELGEAANRRWITGVIRNSASMRARTAARRKLRDGAWLAVVRQEIQPPQREPHALRLLEDLTPALKPVAALALSGHSRREIAYLLRISDAALRQRILALKRQFALKGVAMPDGYAGLTLDLAYGRMRQALLPGFQRRLGVFASHDPDGHLFYVSRSQSP
jgi:DNA-directed RNA polymerase specialized sigma24 family protein